MKALVIGLGMGQQYSLWLKELGYEVYTVDVDPAKKASYSDISFALRDHPEVDITYIGTPNWTHEPIARSVALSSKLVLIEKPGVKSSKEWTKLVSNFPGTRFMMVKNNQFRKEIELFKQQAAQSERVYIRWNNANRIPNPGSWFTTKSKSFGGVSRDLMPHMLSYYCTLTDYNKGVRLFAKASQRYELHELTSTDYGVVDQNGTYDVDDWCEIEFKNGNTTWVLTANWKTNLDHDDSSISFCVNNYAIRHELGLCPGDAYKNMITQAMQNLNNKLYWENQLAQDVWIHTQIENL